MEIEDYRSGKTVIKRDTNRLDELIFVKMATCALVPIKIVFFFRTLNLLRCWKETQTELENYGSSDFAQPCGHSNQKTVHSRTKLTPCSRLIVICV